MAFFFLRPAHAGLFYAFAAGHSAIHRNRRSACGTDGVMMAEKSQMRKPPGAVPPGEAVAPTDAQARAAVAAAVGVEAGQVLAWRDYGRHVVVVTVDGRKLSSAAQQGA